MRRLLFVHDERYLDRAFQSVQDLLAIERRLSKNNGGSDLLAVLLMSPSSVDLLLSQEQECEPPRLGDRNPLFNSDSVSVNGMWILVTLSHHDFLGPRKRNEALGRLLCILRTQGYVHDLATVFPVFPSDETEQSIREQVTFLRSEHPDLAAANLLVIDVRPHRSGRRRVID